MMKRRYTIGPMSAIAGLMLLLVTLFLGAWFPYGTGTSGSTLPTVSSVSPNNGSTAGGTSVAVGGTNYGTGGAGVTAIKFGTTNATSFSCSSSTACSATSPVGSAGVVDITVTTAAGTSATSSADQFTYNSNCTPSWPAGTATYYLAAPPLGNDSNTGTSETTGGPWATLGKLAANITPSSTTFLRGCDTFTFAPGGTLTVPAGATVKSVGAGIGSCPATGGPQPPSSACPAALIVANVSGFGMFLLDGGASLIGLHWRGDNDSTQIVSGTYASGTTNYITLTMASAVPYGAGVSINLVNLAGTGAFASLAGTWTTVAGTGGSTVVLQGPSAAGAATINLGQAEYIATTLGAFCNNVQNCVISGNTSENFYGNLGIHILVSGDSRGTQITNNTIQGIHGPLSRDEVGVFFNFNAVTITGNPADQILIQSNLIQNIGATVNGTSQMGFGAHITVLQGSPTFAGAVPFTWGSNGEPTNAISYLHANTIRSIGARINTCGGASGIEWGSSAAGWENSNEISYVGPIGTATATISGTTLTINGNVGGMSLDDFAALRTMTGGALGNVTIAGGGVASGTGIVSGSGTTWTVSTSNAVGPVKLTFLGNAGGACDQDGTDIDSGDQNILRERDFVHDVWGPCVLDWMGSSPGPVMDRYNLGVNCGVQAEGAHAVQGEGAGGIFQSYNNTYIGLRGPTPAGAVNLSLSQSGSLVGFDVNNIYITDYQQWEVLITDPLTTFTLSHNNYGGIGNCCGGAPGWQFYQTGGTQFNNDGHLAWVAAGAGSDQSGFFVDPLFSNPYGTGTSADWSLSNSSPLLNVGVDVTASPWNATAPPAADFYGNLPSSGKKNIGADAYGSP